MKEFVWRVKRICKKNKDDIQIIGGVALVVVFVWAVFVASVVMLP